FFIENKRNKSIVEDDGDAGLDMESTVEENISILRQIITLVVGLVVMHTIFGGIYTGVFTPTEAGAVGSVIALLAAIILGKVNFNFFKVSLVETVKLSGMVMLIMIGAQIFGKFVSLSL